MNVGTTLPQFRHDGEAALETARVAEETGLAGVFVFDHLWPLGQPERPALHSKALLGALSVETTRVTLGTLVARVGLLPDAILVHELQTLRRMTGDRFVAGLGTGDAGNRDENLAYGVPNASKDERLARLAACCDRLRDASVPTWAGGRSPELRLVAARHAGGWNTWQTDPVMFAADAAGVRALAGERAFETTWGGQVLVGRTRAHAAEKLERHGTRPGLVHGTVDDLVAHLEALAEGGASWAICAPLDVGVDPEALELLGQAAERVR